MTQTGRLTTHVLDTANGHPARGMAIGLFSVENGLLTPLKDVHTNADGRVDSPLLAGAEMATGVFELQFDVGQYFKTISGLEPGFLDVVPVRFRIGDLGAHYHVPLLVSPYGYSTYRGS